MTELAQEYLRMVRNFAVSVKCSPVIYRIIIDWTWEKDCNETIEEYLKRNDLLKNTHDKKWAAKHPNKLGNIHLVDFDVTFLHILLPIICWEKIASPGSREYNERLQIPNSVEILLKSIKDKRNDICHDKSKMNDPQFIENLLSLLIQCLESAGKLYGKEISEIDHEKKNISDQFEKIIEDTSLDKNRVKLIEEVIMTKMIDELEIIADEYSIFQPLPGCLTSKLDMSKNFYCLHLARLKYVAGNKEMRENFSYFEIFDEIAERFTLISGNPGAGKTTTMRNLFIEKVKTYKTHKSDLPLYIECRSEDSKNLEEYLKKNITELNRFDEEELRNATWSLDNIIFFVDGYDEVNGSSNNLVKSIIEFCRKMNRKCVISGRVKATYDMECLLEKGNLKYNHFSIEPITKLKDKIEFLENYGQELDHIKKQDIVKNFTDLDPSAQEVFSSPILLSLFYFMVTEDIYCNISFQDDSDVNEKIFDFFKDKMEEIIDSSQNKLQSAYNIMHVISEYSLELFNQGKYFLLKDDFITLTNKCKEKCPDVVNLETCISSLLSPQFSLRDNKKKTYQFPHSTIQELFAAKGLIRKLNEKRFNANRNLFTRSSSTSRSKRYALLISNSMRTHPGGLPKYSRYEKIMSFMIVMLHRKNELHRFVDPISLFMKENMKRGERFWFDLISKTGYSNAVIKIARVAIVDFLDWWRIYEEKHQRAASKLLRFTQPREIGLKCDHPLTGRDDLIEMMESIGQYYRGKITIEFEYSFDNYEPADVILMKLKDSKCQITYVKACVSSTKTISMLKKRSEGITISFLSSSTPNLKTLQKCKIKHMEFAVKYSEEIRDKEVNPLPTYADECPVRLTVTDIPVEGYNNLKRIINDIAPNNKLFEKLLLKRCYLLDSAVIGLSKDLYDKGFKTKGNSYGVIKRSRYDPPEFQLLEDGKSSRPDETFLHIEEVIPSNQEFEVVGTSSPMTLLSQVSLQDEEDSKVTFEKDDPESESRDEVADMRDIKVSYRPGRFSEEVFKEIEDASGIKLINKN